MPLVVVRDTAHVQDRLAFAHERPRRAVDVDDARIVDGLPVPALYVFVGRHPEPA